MVCAGPFCVAYIGLDASKMGRKTSEILGNWTLLPLQLVVATVLVTLLYTGGGQKIERVSEMKVGSPLLVTYVLWMGLCKWKRCPVQLRLTYFPLIILWFDIGIVFIPVARYQSVVNRGVVYWIHGILLGKHICTARGMHQSLPYAPILMLQTIAKERES